MSEWKETALNDISEITAGYAFKGDDFSDNGDELVVKIKDIQEPFVDTKGATKVFFRNYSYEKLEKFKISKGDFVIAMTGATIGKIGRYVDGGHAYINQRVAKFDAKNNNDKRYIYYITQHQDFRTHILNNIDSQSAQGNISTTSIARYRLFAPSLSEQKAIAAILGALDDKIELNRRMNATLEAMARALFKSWFVDFDPVRAKMAGAQPFGMDSETAALFPSRLVPSELGDIPEGWVPSNLVAEFDITMGQSPPGETYNECGEGLPFYQGRTDFGSRYPSRRIFCTQPNRVAEVGDTLISVRAPVGDINMAFEKCILGRGVAALRHKSNARGYTYYALHSVQPDLKAFEADGTVFGSVNKQDLGKIKIVQAKDGLIKQFEAVVGDIDEKILTLTIENARLEKTRDYLLPKLISGDIRIPDVEKFVEVI